LALFQVHSPLLVIADYNLPDSRHGLQLLAEIRRITPAVRLVLLSAYIDDQDVHDIEALGLVDRAIPKLQAGATEDLLSELEDARRRAETTTDWPAYARAHREARRVEQPDIDALDARIRKARGIN
jgi:CheY-like chemotaxis protein